MARYLVTVHRQDGREFARLGPVEFMSTARRAMLRHARLTHLPTEEPATRSDVLEVWVIGDRQYRIRKAPQAIASNIRSIRALT